MAHAAAKQAPIGQLTRRRRRGFDKKAQAGARCLFLAGLTQDQECPTGTARLQAQTAAFGQPEFLQIAMHLEEHGRKGTGHKCGFRKPQCILDPAGHRMDDFACRKAEIDKSRPV